MESLDLSFNNLSALSLDYFSALTHLKKLVLRETSLFNYTFLSSLNEHVYLDVSGEERFAGEYLTDDFSFSHLHHLSMANTSLRTLQHLDATHLKSLNQLDVSHNDLTYFALDYFAATRLDLSHNAFEFFVSDELEITDFIDYCETLAFFNVAHSLSPHISNKIFSFNKALEFASFSANRMSTFPRFCQSIDIDYVGECQLRTLYFDSNGLDALLNRDLMDMVNLEYLDLDNNRISFVESQAFSYLYNLDTLVLSRNKLTSFNGSTRVFSYLYSLRVLNLSMNSLEVVPGRLFDSLLKLETLDMSHNKIYLVQNFSFDGPKSLRHLYINSNQDDLSIESRSFVGLDSIQNVYLSSPILTRDSTRSILIDMFNSLNRRALEKNRVYYFRSLALISTSFGADCALVLYFIRWNVHLNLNTDQDVFDFFVACDSFLLKETRLSFADETRFVSIVSNSFPYLFWIFLLATASLGCYLCYKN